MWTGRGRQTGFTYIGVLLLVAIVGIGLAATATVWHFQVQRDKERQLLVIGNEFRQALDRYATYGVGGRRFPTRLEDLLLDERTAAKRRHLRRIYVDPMTGSAEWGVVRTADGQITGVHSLSEAKTIKRANFGLRDQAFVGKESYDQWVFFASTARATALLRSSGVANTIGKPIQ